MLRHRELLVFLGVACLLSCGGPDKQAINAFFSAVESGDEKARAAVSSVDFPGAVESWEIVEVVKEVTTVPFALPELREQVRVAQTEVDFQAQKYGIFLDDNKRLHQQYKARLASNPDFEFKGELAEFKEELDALNEEEKRLKSELDESNRRMEAERNAAGISLMGASVTGDFDGEVDVMEYSVRVNDKPYKFTLSKYNLVNKVNQMKPRSRWVITDIQEQGD
jgi:hypothetical protein